MRVRSKRIKEGRALRLESYGEIKEVLINEDIMHPDRESVSVCYIGENSSGIIDFTPEEIEQMHKAVTKKTKLVKGFKVVKASGI